MAVRMRKFSVDSRHYKIETSLIKYATFICNVRHAMATTYQYLILSYFRHYNIQVYFESLAELHRASAVRCNVSSVGT